MAQYISRRTEHRIVIRPTDRTMDEQRRISIIKGKDVTFFDHFFETNDPEIIDRLDSHPQRGKDFDKLEGVDLAVAHQAIRRLKNNESIKVVSGASTVSNRVQPKAQEAPVILPMQVQEPITRSEDTTLVSPELIKIIDDRVNTALATIIDLLKVDEKKEEKAKEMMEGKSTKAFKCPYCDQVFSSGFKVGKHKKDDHANYLSLKSQDMPRG